MYGYRKTTLFVVVQLECKEFPDFDAVVEAVHGTVVNGAQIKVNKSTIIFLMAVTLIRGMVDH